MEYRLWELHYKRCPPGDPILRELVAMLAIVLENFMSSDEDKPPRPLTQKDIDRHKRWFFWRDGKEWDELAAEEGSGNSESEIAEAWGPAYARLQAETRGE